VDFPGGQDGNPCQKVDFQKLLPGTINVRYGGVSNSIEDISVKVRRSGVKVRLVGPRFGRETPKNY